MARRERGSKGRRSRGGSGREEAIKDAHKRKGRTSDRTWYLAADVMEKKGIKTYKAEVGTNFLAIIPPTDLERHFAFEVHVHYDVGPNNSAYVCPRKWDDSACPVCEEFFKLKRSGEDIDDDVLRSMAPKRRFLMLVLDMKNDKTMDEGLMLYDFPSTVHDEIIELCVEARSGAFIDISQTDENGTNVIFSRKGKGMMDTRYFGFKLDDPRDEGLPAELFEDAPGIEDLLTIPDYETLEAELKGPQRSKRTEVEEDDDEEEEPARRSKRRSRDEDDDDEEDDDDDSGWGDDDEDEDELRASDEEDLSPEGLEDYRKSKEARESRDDRRNRKTDAEKVRGRARRTRR